MEILVGPALRIIEATGQVGAIVAGVIVALALAVIVFAKTTGILNTARKESQEGDFQAKLLRQMDRLMEREGALQERMSHLQAEADRIEAENAQLKDEVHELRMQTVLMRNALRRAIDLLRAVSEGRIPPERVSLADLDGAGA